VQLSWWEGDIDIAIRLLQLLWIMMEILYSTYVHYDEVVSQQSSHHITT